MCPTIDLKNLKLAILGSYNNWKIIDCIDIRNQHEATNTDIMFVLNIIPS